MVVDAKAQIYEKHLQLIPGLHNAKKFTPREIDVIACIVNKKLNAQISTLLEIGIDGVETHIRNIMIKIDCASREEIVDFISKSGKLQYIEEIYLHIEQENAFIHQFQLIKRNFFKTKSICAIWGNERQIKNNLIFKKFKNHCERLFGITFKFNPNKLEEINYHFYILTSASQIDIVPNKNFLIFESDTEMDQDIKQFNIVDFSKNDYFFSVLSFLELVIGKEQIEPYYKTAEIFGNNFQQELGNLYAEIQKQNLENRKLVKKQSILLVYLVFCTVIVTMLILFLTCIEQKPAYNIIAPNLALPNKTVLLQRKAILEKIDQTLNKQDGIKIAVLFGVGGSGKTTLSHQYVKLYAKDASLIWELNAESKESLTNSLKQLAFALCTSNTEKEELITICNLTNANEQTEQLEIFIGKRVVRYPHWLVIYDNVKAFNDIQWYFPTDVKSWGPGKVIINTMDYNMMNNPLIPKSSIIEMDELAEAEKLELFSSILQEQEVDHDEAIKFLEHLPPFPLDVELAATFIKDQKINYEDYLNQLAKPTKEFTSIQENILIDMGAYAKTRYKIIQASIEKLAINPDFRDLLLFISLLDAKNIPQNLLIKFKDKVTVHKLVSELKKYALISESNDNEIQTFSMHRCTQQGILAYLNLSDISKNPQLLAPMAEILGKYMDQEYENYNITESYIIASTAENFLAHSKLFDETQQLGIVTALGQYYFFFGDLKKTTEYLNQALTIVQKFYSMNNLMLAKIERLLGNLSKAQGHYHKAHRLLANSYDIYKNHYGEEDIRTIATSADLAYLYGHLENYEKAENLLKNALDFYQLNYSNQRIKIAEIQTHLGHIYNVLGKREEAKKIVEEAVSTYQQVLGKNHICTTWSSLYLSTIYRDLSYHNKAKSILKNGLEVYRKYYGDQHSKVAYVLEELANLYVLAGNYVEAEKLFKQSLEIYELNKHGKIYTCVEALGDLYIKKYKNAPNLAQKADYKEKAKQYLNQALNLRKALFLNDSKAFQNQLIKIQQLEQDKVL